MSQREAEQLLESLLSETCTPEIERKKGRTLFYCDGELAGSVAPLGNKTLAVTVYSKSKSDSVHGKFLSKARELFEGKVVKEGTRPSSGFEGNFYYSFVNVKL